MGAKRKYHKKRYPAAEVAFRAIRQPFLDFLVETPYVKAAAKAVKYPLQSLYYRRKIDEKFREEWDHAIDAGVQAISGELYRRGVVGVQKIVVSAGRMVMQQDAEGVQRPLKETVYSDQCLITLIRAHDPKFRETRMNVHVGKDGGPIQTVDLNAIIAQKEKELLELGGDPIAVKRGLIQSLIDSTAGRGNPEEAKN